MDFGRVENIEAVDFTLPPDHSDTGLVLQASLKKSPAEVYAGCAKWGRKEWLGKIYPLKTKESDFLKHYAKNYNSIELNAVHYRIPPAAWVEKWKNLTDETFRFCPKMYQGVTHIQRLKKAEYLTETFLNVMSGFGKRLGTIFIQLPPNFGPKNFNDLAQYIRTLPKEFSFAIEFRHPDWFMPSNVTDETFHLLRENRIAAVITDAAGRRDVLHQRLTTPVAFIRFVGNSLHPTDYARIDDWVSHLKGWLHDGLQQLYFFMHHHDERYSPELSTYLARRMNEVCRLRIQEPQWQGALPPEAMGPVK